MGDWYNDNNREVFGKDRIREFVRGASPYFIVEEMLNQYGSKNMELILKESFFNLEDTIQSIG